jgi:hypothetical protein
MLYKLCDHGAGKTDINPMPFLDYGDIRELEKDLEVLFADHLLVDLFEETPLMPIFQERQFQSEADLYTLRTVAAT